MSDIDEQEINVFVDSVIRYFSMVTGEKAEIRSVFLADRKTLPPIYEFTGLIAFSGNYRGCIYFSADRKLLEHLLLAMREPRQTDEHLLDAVGEIANTLAGNAREHFGEGLSISVPKVSQGDKEQVKAVVRARLYVITMKWKGQEASVIIDITRE